jgi:hypothetical protein
MTVARQANLFAAEQWRTAYKAFSEIDFQAYDFDTMRSAMVNYVRTNFPENFNDYIESSEFIAIIELLAFLSQSLAFRMDINTRENFLETAERRDSVYKLARMLGYNPKRNFPASGLMKIVAVRTNQALRDSRGTSLQGRTIAWDDANDNMSYEQFLTVLNAVMSRTNRFTAPVKEGTLGGVPTELYQLNTSFDSPIAYNFNLNINGASRGFNVCNADFQDQGYMFERHPDPTNLFHIVYRNDGRGLASTDTGFFTFFRQGSLTYTDFNYTNPIASREEIVPTLNINETDVYLQEINSGGVVQNKWTRIPNTVGQTLNYNSVSQNTRNLYSIENLGQDGIKIRYPDGNFGNIPIGIYRFWHRVSDNQRYTIAPSDAQNVNITMPYVGQDGRSYNLTVTMSLQTTVRNSTPAETVEAIKNRAPRVYYTQNRMVSAQDYNVFPESISSNITKLKAVNKTHAGHSRYIDINDPTGTYNNIDTYAKDAYIYVDETVSTEQVTVSSTNTPLEILTVNLFERLKERQVNNFVYYGMRDYFIDPLTNGDVNNFRFELTDGIRWNPQPARSTAKTGYLTERITANQDVVLINNPSVAVVNSYPRTAKFRELKENCFLKFVSPNNPQDYKWVRAVGIANNGQLNSSLVTDTGPWTLSEEVTAGWYLSEVIVSLRKLLSNTEAKDAEREMLDRKTFGLGYDIIQDSWYVIPREEVNTTDDYAIDLSGRGPRSWLVLFELVPGSLTDNEYKYNVTVRGQDYIVQSKTDLRFYNISDVKIVDRSTRSSKDTIEFSTVNSRPGEAEVFVWDGSEWALESLGETYRQSGALVNLPLKTRDTLWRDVEVDWVSNFGIFQVVGATVPDRVSENRYVSDTVVPLTTAYPAVSVPLGTADEVVIANNSGVISVIPDSFDFAFDDNTFGVNVVDETGTAFILYRGKPIGGSNPNASAPLIFKAEVGSESYSMGADGTVVDTGTKGHLDLLTWDAGTRTGTLRYKNLHDGAHHRTSDRTGAFSTDKLSVYYNDSREQLSEAITWEIVDVFREPDGYVDPRKAIVLPIDTDGDLVPDKPRQITDYVGPRDLVLFDQYTDFDGFTYDRPFEGVILDYRSETSIRYEAATQRISPVSYTAWSDINQVDWLLVKDKTAAESLLNIQPAAGIVVYVADEERTYVYTAYSTDTNQVMLEETDQYFAKRGRGATQSTVLPRQDGVVRWRHIAPNDVRIDPSISNLVEMVILSDTYNTEVQQWKTRFAGEFPLPPTPNELAVEFAELNTYKSASDSLVYRSASFKLLFGEQADDLYRAKFRVVKLSDELSDNEIKTQIITAIDDYFDVANWDFGETFYFTELATYIHQRLGSALGSIVILPKTVSGTFGEMFQVKAEPNELFISTASVKDIEIVGRLDNQTLRVDR